MRHECKACGARLWSQYAQDKGVCPECEQPNAEQPTELEGYLTEVQAGEGWKHLVVTYCA